MTVLQGGPPLRPINAGYETEHQAGLDAGLSGLPCTMPVDGDGWALYPSPGPQFAAWCRGWAKGAVQRTCQQTRERLAAERAAPYATTNRRTA